MCESKLYEQVVGFTVPAIFEKNRNGSYHLVASHSHMDQTGEVIYPLDIEQFAIDNGPVDIS